MTKPINVLDQALPMILEAVQEWKDANCSDKIKDRVKKLLDANSKEVTMKLLGFNDHWGKWEIDPCNGRSGESAAGDFIRKTQSEAVKDWLTNVCLPELDDKTKAQFKKQAKQIYQETILRGLRDSVQMRAKVDLDLLVKEITASNQIDNYLKTMQLLSSSGE